MQPMTIGVLRETGRAEARVAATPQSVEKLTRLGYQVLVESGAGVRANFPDPLYESAGAEIVSNASNLLERTNINIKVSPPSLDQINDLAEDSTLISFLWPAKNKEELELLSRRRISTLAMDCVPRISRAQKLDALSSMANIAGYRAVVEAANEFGSFFTGQITAAGKIPPAKVLVIGAGVAGLAAIGTAKSLGAIVRAFDTRMAVKDQVKSMGADFLVLEFEESGEGEGGYAKTMSDEFIAAEMALFADQAREVDIIITTALIPGKPAPKLITREMVESMRPGSVVVDLAAEQGGNCEVTKADELVRHSGVSIIGYTDLPSRLPTQSSSLFANNIVNLLTDMTPEKDGQLVVDLDDVVVRGTLVTYAGDITYPPPKIQDPSPPSVESSKPQPSEQIVTSNDEQSPVSHMIWSGVALVLGALLLWLIGNYADREFIGHLTVFMLACFVGWQLVWSVTPALHTPLMSVTNAISGIIVIGGMVQIKSLFGFSSILAMLAVLIATINVAGGFLVTHRMLGMFRKQD